MHILRTEDIIIFFWILFQQYLYSKQPLEARDLDSIWSIGTLLTAWRKTRQWTRESVTNSWLSWSSGDLLSQTSSFAVSPNSCPFSPWKLDVGNLLRSCSHADVTTLITKHLSSLLEGIWVFFQNSRGMLVVRQKADKYHSFYTHQRRFWGNLD